MMSIGALAGLSLGSLSCTKAGVEEFLQKHFREMTEEEKKQVIRRLEEKYLKKYGRKSSDQHTTGRDRGPLGIRPRSVPLHRLPQVRLRLRERK